MTLKGASLGGVILAISASCSPSPGPAAPSSTTTLSSAVVGNGSALKIAAPTLVSPVGGAIVLANAPLVLTWQNVNGTYASFPVIYEVEFSTGTALISNRKVPAASGDVTSVTITPTPSTNTSYSWRVRATHDDAVGPWSVTESFLLSDPLTQGFATYYVKDTAMSSGTPDWAITFRDGPRAGVTETAAEHRLSPPIWSAFPSHVRFTAALYAPTEMLVSIGTSFRFSNTFGREYNVPLTFVGAPNTDVIMTQTVNEKRHAFVMAFGGTVEIRSWWLGDYDEHMDVTLYCGGQLVQTSRTLAASGGKVIITSTFASPQSCEVAVLPRAHSSTVKYRLTIAYPH